jgi:hypothetical protein
MRSVLIIFFRPDIEEEALRMQPRRIVRSLVVMILIAVFVSSAAFAQTRRHDLSLSYGFFTMDQLAGSTASRI